MTADGTSVVAASADRLSVVDLLSGDGRPGASTCRRSPTSRSAAPDRRSSRPSPTSRIRRPRRRPLADILGGDAADYEAKLASPAAGTTVVLGSPGSGDVRTALDKAIADGKLPGIGVEDVPRVAVATSEGVAFVDAARVSLITTMPLDGGAHGLAMVTGLDDPRLYATTGRPDDPGYEVFAIGGDAAKDGPVDQGKHPLPGTGHADRLRRRHPDGPHPRQDPGLDRVGRGSAGPSTSSSRTPTRSSPTRACPPASRRSAWAADVAADYPSADRQQLLVFDGDGTTASIAIGSHAFAWRLPGVIAGALTAGLLFLLARILFRRRLVAVLAGLFVLVDGMFFVQSRIGMNDVYVGLFIVAAYTVFAAIWTGLVARPARVLARHADHRACSSGLALASKWVAAYAIGALVLLILVRSALGRVLAILGMIGLTAVLGYMAISVPGGRRLREPDVPADHGRAHPASPSWSPSSIRSPGPTTSCGSRSSRPMALGTLVFFGALGARAAADRVRARLGRRSRRCCWRSRSASARWSWPASSRSPVAAGSARWPVRRPRTIRSACSSRRRPPPDGWLRPGTTLGLPVRVGRGLPGRPPARRLRALVPALGDDRGPPDLSPGWPRRATPARRCST